jgi:hypothetical protein
MKAWSYLILHLLSSYVSAYPQHAPRQDATSSAYSASLSAIIAKASLAPYTAPNAERKITEWLALGDSYAVGVGSDFSDDWIESSQKCYRFKQAYPLQMQYDSRMPGDVDSRVLTFGACSGATTKDITDFQINQGTPNILR